MSRVRPQGEGLDGATTGFVLAQHERREENGGEELAELRAGAAEVEASQEIGGVREVEVLEDDGFQLDGERFQWRRHGDGMVSKWMMVN